MTETTMPPKTKLHMRQVVILLEPDLHQAFKIATAEAGTTMQDVLAKTVEDYAADALRRLRRKSK